MLPARAGSAGKIERDAGRKPDRGATGADAGCAEDVKFEWDTPNRAGCAMRRSNGSSGGADGSDLTTPGDGARRHGAAGRVHQTRPRQEMEFRWRSRPLASGS